MSGIEQLIERLSRSSVQVLNRGGGGSGVVWDAQGHIVTNAHVMRGEEARIVDADGRRHRARVLKRDTERDLAYLETGSALEPATFGDSDQVRAGQVAIAVGNPLGVTGAVAAGAIHTAGGGRWIQADIRLAPGNSGGILADAEGRVIGINTMIYQGLGLAVPSNDAVAFIKGEPARGRLGVEMIPVEQGLAVVRIEKNSLAERSDVRIGDILRCAPHALRDLIYRNAALPILRGGRELTLGLAQQEARAA
jgi:serine protease Do